MGKYEKEFREVASSEVEDAMFRYDSGCKNLESATPESRFTPERHFNSAGEAFAFSLEHGLKSSIIYDDFRRSKYFTQESSASFQIGNKTIEVPVIGSNEWKAALAGRIPGLNFISNPKEIHKKIILENDSNDERRKIETDPKFNYEFLTLSYGDSKVTGHSLYAYYQLQSPIAKSLINSAYYCYVEDEAKYTIYALLTEDILTSDNEGKTLMPREFMEKLDSVKHAAVDLRYASISDEHIGQEDLIFLKEFSYSVIDATEYRFPIPNELNKIKSDIRNYSFDFNWFNNLDNMTKYYLVRYFSKKEINEFKSFVDILNKKGDTPIDIIVFINNSIYFKNYFTNKMQIQLEFTEKQFARIYHFCMLIKSFQPFDSNSKRLCDNDAFSTKEKREQYIMKINKLKESNKTQKQDQIISLDDQINIFIRLINDRVNENLILLSKKIKEVIKMPIKEFWHTNKDKIIQKLFVEENDNPEYETARQTILNHYKVSSYEELLNKLQERRENKKQSTEISIEEKTTIFINMLNKGNSNILNQKNTEVFEGTTIPVGQFWSRNKDKIIQKLFVEEKDNLEYETARQTILDYYNVRTFEELLNKLQENSENQKQSQSISVEEKTTIFINMLKQGNSTILKTGNNPELLEGTTIPVGQFWSRNKDKIIQKLFVEEKGNPEYEKARQTILNKYKVSSYEELLNKLQENSENQKQSKNISVEDKITIFINMLNKGNDNILKDRNTELFEGTTIKVGYFWQVNRDKIIRKLFVEEKGNPEYETARQTILKKYDKGDIHNYDDLLTKLGFEHLYELSEMRKMRIDRVNELNIIENSLTDEEMLEKGHNKR